MMPRYVWLDRLSVPQDDQPLKFTLLARMMAVYTAAKVTVAIRTFEESGSRYHQRAWTCQEFGIARRLVVATQEPGPGDTRTALSPECDERMAVLRKRIQSKSFVPLWLRSNSSTTALEKVTEMSRADGEFILKEFYSLSDHLNCKFPGDRLRALLPLVSCAPLEDHQELVSLVLAISRATGDGLLDWKESLLKQHQKEKRIAQRNSSKERIKSKQAACVSWWDGNSPAADQETGIFDLSINNDWQVWKPESTFRARVMGKVSQESVLEECNQLLEMRNTVSLSSATSAIVPHKKRRILKRNSTISNLSEASSHGTKNSAGPTRSCTRSSVGSFMSTEAPASVCDDLNVSFLLDQPKDQVAQQRCGRRLPSKQKSLPCSASFARSGLAPPGLPDQNAPCRQPLRKQATMPSIVMLDRLSFGQDGLADQGARRSPKQRGSLISSIASAQSMSSGSPEVPTTNTVQAQEVIQVLTDPVSNSPSAVPEPWYPATDDGLMADRGARRAPPPKKSKSLITSIASALSMRRARDGGKAAVGPPKRASLFSMIASRLSMGSAHGDESAQERVRSMDSASLKSALEITGHVSGSECASVAGAKDTMSDTLSHTSEASDGWNLYDAASATSTAPESGVVDDSPTHAVGCSTDVRFIKPVRRSVSQGISLKSNDDSQSREDSAPGMPSLHGDVKREVTKTPSLPSVLKPPVPMYKPKPALEVQRFTDRVLLPSLPGPPGYVGPSASGSWNLLPALLSSFVSSKTPAVPNNVTALPEAAKPDSCFIDMPGSSSADEALSIAKPTARPSQANRCTSSELLMSSTESLGRPRRGSSRLAPISDDGQQSNDGSSHPFAPADDILLSMEIDALKNDVNGGSANMRTQRLGMKELRRITEWEGDDGDESYLSTGSLQRFLADAAKHSGKLCDEQESKFSNNESGFNINGMELGE